MAGILYLVPTPIGNLNDISPRCAQTLAEADFIAAEDTRVSLKLLNHLEIKKSLVSYHEHNKAESGSKILVRLLAGEKRRKDPCAPARGRDVRAGDGRGLPRHLRSRRGLSSAVCGEWRNGLRDSGTVRAGDGAEYFGASDWPVYV